MAARLWITSVYINGAYFQTIVSLVGCESALGLSFNWRDYIAQAVRDRLLHLSGWGWGSPYCQPVSMCHLHGGYVVGLCFLSPNTETSGVHKLVVWTSHLQANHWTMLISLTTSETSCVCKTGCLNFTPLGQLLNHADIINNLEVGLLEEWGTLGDVSQHVYRGYISWEWRRISPEIGAVAGALEDASVNTPLAPLVVALWWSYWGGNPSTYGRVRSTVMIILRTNWITKFKCAESLVVFVQVMIIWYSTYRLAEVAHGLVFSRLFVVGILTPARPVAMWSLISV